MEIEITGDVFTFETNWDRIFSYRKPKNNMKISYKTHPALEILENKDYSKMRVLPNSKIPRPNSVIHNIIKGGIGKKYAPTNTFIEAFERARGSFKDHSMLNELESQTTAVIFKEMVTVIRIDNDGKGGTPIFYYCKFFNDVLFAYGSFIIDCNSNQIVADKECNDIGVDPTDNPDSAQLIGAEMALLLFIRFAEVETKVLPPKSETNFISCSYKNHTKSIVTILNCTWFTNLVKSDAFKVRGHFRLQPKKKDGEWTKELIWIDEFMKDGYTAPARKLAQSTTS